MQSYDFNIEQAQRVTKGAVVTVALDLFEVNSQSFTVSSATVSLFDGDGVESSTVSGVTCSLATGLRSSTRVQFTMQSGWTSGLTDSDDYSLVWTLTLSDGQTRIARQGLEVRSA